VKLMVARGVEQDQIYQSVVLVVAIPMMQLDLLLNLDHLPTDWAEPVL
jgi:hypothetical protein